VKCIICSFYYFLFFIKLQPRPESISHSMGMFHWCCVQHFANMDHRSTYCTTCYFCKNSQRCEKVRLFSFL